MPEPKSIMCFGDSLTWGWIPVAEGAPSRRYPVEQRWTGVMATALGDGYTVIEEGLCARTTSASDPNDPRLDGSAHLPVAVATHLPLDLVVLMLGTNDTKAIFRRTPFEIAYGMAKLVGQVASSAGDLGTVYAAPKCLVVAPPPLAPMPHPYFQGMFEGGYEKSVELNARYHDMADLMKADFFNAGEVVTTGGVDGIHFSVENNATLGKALAVKVKEVLADS